MFQKSLFRLSPPRFAYQRLKDIDHVALPAAPRRMVLFCDHPLTRNDRLQIQAGDPVKTGQKLVPFADSDAYVIATATGTIQDITPFSGDFGRRWTRIDLAVAGAEVRDPAFAEEAAAPSTDALRRWLADTPGGLPLADLCAPVRPIQTLVVAATEADLLTVTAQYVLRHRTAALQRGIDVLRTLTGAERTLLAVPQDTVQGMGHVHADLAAVPTWYPAGAPALMIRHLLGREVPADSSLAQQGICVVPAEAAASLGQSFAEGRLCLDKTVTVIAKDGNLSLVTVRLGTPVADICTALGIAFNDGDRLIVGGPMAGLSVYTADYPVRPDTHTLMVQDAAGVTRASDYPCINCGECVRICPARVPVNMLVRLLEAGQYAEAADRYDLLSCVECGLCSYVCSARIPIFQYIRLAKHELALSATAEADNV